MAQKELDKSKGIFKTLTAEIRKYGIRGDKGLKRLFEYHHPEDIFKLESGPDREARAALLIADMRNLSMELALGERKVREISGVYSGFRYTLTEFADGLWTAKINRRGRNIISEPGAPPIVDSTNLKKKFTDQEGAELAVRRVINSALIWYSERGKTPREKVRRSKAGRAGNQRRTAGQCEILEREVAEEDVAAAEEERREGVRAARRQAKVDKHERSRRPSEPSKTRRKISYIPRKNPSSPFSFDISGLAAVNQGDRSFEKYKKWEGVWEKSLESGTPDFSAVMKAYDYAENARANFKIGESALELSQAKLAKAKADKAHESKRVLRRNIIKVFNFCARAIKARHPNPTNVEHQKLALLYMGKADDNWEKYSTSNSYAALLRVYKYLELARAEFTHAGNGEYAEQANARIKLVLQELKGALSNA